MSTTQNTYWMAWSDKTAWAEYFETRREAEDYLRRNGGGEMRRFKREGRNSSTTMDPIRVDVPAVTTYKLFAGNGRYIRQATQVEFADGRVVRFMEKLSKREALRQVTAR